MNGGRKTNTLGYGGHLTVNTIEPQIEDFEDYLFPELAKELVQTELVTPSHPNFSISRKNSVVSTDQFNLGILKKSDQLTKLLEGYNFPNQPKFEQVNVAKTFVQKIKNSDFDGYLNEVEPIFDTYKKNLGYKGPVLTSGESENEREAELDSLPSLEGLPTQFFDKEFSLETAKTFSMLCGLAKDEDIIESELDLITSSKLQDVLTAYLDDVEAHLVHEIANRSDGFFEALNLLQTLESDTTSCIEEISESLDCLNEIKKHQASVGLNVMKLKLRKENMLGLSDTVNLVQKALLAKPAIDALLGSKDPLGTLNLLDELDLELTSNFTGSPISPQVSGHGELALPKSMSRSSSSGPELKVTNITSQLKCLAPFYHYQQSARAQALDQLTVQFVNLLTGEPVYRTNSSKATIPTPSQAVKALMGPEGTMHFGTSESSQTAKIELDRVKGPLKPLVRALIHTRHLPSSLASAGSALAESVHTCLASTITSCLDTLSSAPAPQLPSSPSKWKGSEMGILLSSLPLDTYVDHLSVCFYKLVELVHRQSRVQAIIESLVDQVNSEPDSNLTSGLRSHFIREIRSTAHQSFDSAQIRCGVLLELKEMSQNISLEEFHKVYSVSWRLIAHLEASGGASASSPRSAILSHANQFLLHFHDLKLTSLSKAIEKDNWAAAQVHSNQHHVIDHLLFSLHHPYHHPGLTIPSDITIPTKPTTDKLSINGIEFYCSSSGLLVIELARDYLMCSINLPALASDVAGRVVSLLETFNAGSCQMVLGAGAMRSAGLSRISARHISIASQTLGSILALMPGLRRGLELSLGPQRAVMASQLDRVGSDVIEHQSQLHSKLVAILADRATIHLHCMATTDFDTPTSSPTASKFMVELVQDVQALHRIMAKYLHPSDTQKVITQVNLDYAEMVEQNIHKLKIETPRAKRKLLKDVQYLIEGLAPLPTQVANLHHLEVVVNDIKL